MAGFELRTHREGNERPAKYSLFVPHRYDASQACPLIVFLHGAGETGFDGQRPAKVGLGPAIARLADSFPFLAVFPQSQHASWQAGTPDAMRALAILDELEEAYRVDRSRVHLTGISIGGYGTWSLAAAFPERWASIVPVCGGGRLGWAPVLKDIPCWAFHGEADELIPVDESRQMISAIREAGGRPRYTEFPGVGHKSWDAAYATPGLFEWMAGQQR